MIISVGIPVTFGSTLFILGIAGVDAIGISILIWIASVVGAIAGLAIKEKYSE